MIIETDHLSVRARAQTLAIIESRGYSGAIASHGWGDDTSRRRIQALGGFVAPYAASTNDFIGEGRYARPGPPPTCGVSDSAPTSTALAANPHLVPAPATTTP